MLYHCVRYAYDDDLPEAEKAEVRRHLNGLDALESVNSVVVGRNVGSTTHEFDEAVLVILPDLDAWVRYQKEPAHSEMLEYMFHRVKAFESCDFTDEDDPDYRDKMGAAMTDGDASEDILEIIGKLAK